MTDVRNWWVNHAPWPFWASCCGVWSPWCWIDDAAHLWFPMTFGFYREKVSHWPDKEPWICRKHSRMAERYANKQLEKFEGCL